MSNQFTESHGAVFTATVKGLLANGHIELAREVVEAMRIACDEATALINAAHKF